MSDVTLTSSGSAAHAGTQDCPCCSSSARTQPGGIRSSKFRSADARFAALTLTVGLTRVVGVQDKESVLADVRGIIAEQLGTEVEKVGPFPPSAAVAVPSIRC